MPRGPGLLDHPFDVGVLGRTASDDGAAGDRRLPFQWRKRSRWMPLVSRRLVPGPIRQCARARQHPPRGSRPALRLMACARPAGAGGVVDRGGCGFALRLLFVVIVVVSWECRIGVEPSSPISKWNTIIEAACQAANTINRTKESHHAEEDAAETARTQFTFFCCKIRAPVTLTLTPKHHAMVKRATKRLGLTRADLIGLFDSISLMPTPSRWRRRSRRAETVAATNRRIARTRTPRERAAHRGHQMLTAADFIHPRE